jgi:23S rRNA pseudouridine1911/1915/1917 synthase
MEISVIYQDQNILVLNKPSGMVVHPFDFSNEKTVLDFLQENYPEVLNIQNTFSLQDTREINLGGIVHKLDRDTSGVLVVAKTQEAFDELKGQFRNHQTQKEYVALVEGLVKEDAFVIDSPLGRSRKDFRQSTNPEKPRGELREAITEVEVLERRSEATLVKLIPKTGRTHQLRAHMNSIGHSIVGDVAYGSTINSERIMLHASKLKFTLREREYEFETETIEGF